VSLFPQNWEERLAESRGILDAAFAQHECSALYACFSGGNDSLTVAHLVSQDPRFAGCVHVNTGIGVPEAAEHVRRVCAQFGWPLFELHPPARTYEDLVLEFGFPGPAAHRFMYSWLKERAVRRFVTEHKRDHRDHLVLATGVRKTESKRRMGTAGEVQQEGGRVWAAPILHWSKCHTEHYIREHSLPVSPVVRKLGLSGECLCGAFADPGDYQRIAEHYPATADYLDALAARAEAAGVHAVWGERPPRPVSLPEDPSQLQLTLCTDCLEKAR
jgi:3'-phosphoadenosine 5'-phosphosulfate sulfotransferase (PAPS reductase)/FAD synthetase